ncbi:MAG: acetylornithine deacetylase [Gammaproteobacteria bacterium]|nr:acetylornithine deacetylase [Gammaproteobacteria bacterium]MDH3537606.1 acetylornithine deacetylase [Gammaproteobacteria bacterium]
MTKGLPEVRDMIAQLIATPSVSCIHADLDMGNRGVIDLVADWAEHVGFSTEIQTVADGKFNLIARAGSGSEGLVLSGHSDTVPCDPNLWTSDPFEARERDDRIYGLGSCDMKSFLALALTASSRVDFDKLQRPLTIVATADEETTMNGAKLIADNGKKLGRYCVIGEPTGLTPIRRHKGNLTMSVEFLGHSGHASDPGLGNNALDGMHQFMTALYAYRDRIQHQYNDPAFTIPTPTMNLGHIHGGDNSNRICGSCLLLIDIRFLPSMSYATLKADIEQIAAEVAEARGLGVATQSFGDGTPAMDTDAASEIAQYLTHLTGKKTGSVAFGTEAPYYNSMRTVTIVIGPGSINQAHQPDEFLPLEHIDPTINMLDALIERFCMA